MRRRTAIASLFLAALARVAGATGIADVRSRFFVTSDGVRLHYLEAGRGRTIVLVPGWTMPAWIWSAQIADFSRSYRVIALDPRSQGESDIAPGGYDPARKGQDIAELLDAIGQEAVLLVGWSLGVLDALAYLHTHGDARLAGLVLVDNSVGEDPPPSRSETPSRRLPKLSRDEKMRQFVDSMFRRKQSPDYLSRLTDACLYTPPHVASALLAIDVPRSYWKEAVYSTNRPILYIVTPRLAGQAVNLASHHPSAEAVRVNDLGHAMFVDDPVRFDALVWDFIRRRVWA